MAPALITAGYIAFLRTPLFTSDSVKTGEGSTFTLYACKNQRWPKYIVTQLKFDGEWKKMGTPLRVVWGGKRMNTLV